MSDMAALDPLEPIMIHWEEYKKTKEYANTLKWATHEEATEGSLWAAFVKGYEAASEPVVL